MSHYFTVGLFRAVLQPRAIVQPRRLTKVRIFSLALVIVTLSFSYAMAADPTGTMVIVVTSNGVGTNTGAAITTISFPSVKACNDAKDGGVPSGMPSGSANIFHYCVPAK
jgi:hypothetical protein